MRLEDPQGQPWYLQEFIRDGASDPLLVIVTLLSRPEVVDLQIVLIGV